MKLEDIIADKDRLFVGEDVPAEYLTDQYIKDINPIHAVALAETHEEVVELVKYAEQEGLKLVPRGAATSVAGAHVPVAGNELIIDLHRMNKIVDLDEETFTLTVEPGVLLSEIHTYLESRGYFYPPDPASKHSSIGGNVATNAGGLRAVKYGTTRDFVKGMKVVLISGETLELGSLNVKNSSGYNLIDLFIGSEGTLGITTEIKLRFIPLPDLKETVLISFEDVSQAAAATIAILGSGADVSELELFEREAVRYAEEHLGYPLQLQDGQAYLLAVVDGNDRAELEVRSNLVVEAAKPFALQTLPLEDGEAEKAKLLRDNILIGLMQLTLYDMLDEVVPINKFAELIDYTKHLQDKHGISVLNFGHAGDGNVHTILMKEDLSDEEWTSRRAALLDDLYAKVHELGGLPAGEHGIGYSKQEYLIKMTDDVNIKYMRKIKAAFDPENRLNPGKLF